MLCGRAKFNDDFTNLSKEIPQRECQGDASEAAILKFLEMTVRVERIKALFFRLSRCSHRFRSARSKLIVR